MSQIPEWAMKREISPDPMETEQAAIDRLNAIDKKIRAVEQQFAQEKYREIERLKDEMEKLKEVNQQLSIRVYQQGFEQWKKVCASEVFQELKHGKYRDILMLLQDGEISVGKAAQSIAELAGGVEPLLPVLSPFVDDDKSWKERYEELKAVVDSTRDSLRDIIKGENNG